MMLVVLYYTPYTYLVNTYKNSYIYDDNNGCNCDDIYAVIDELKGHRTLLPARAPIMEL